VNIAIYQQMLLILDHLNIGGLIVDSERHVVDLNRNAEALLGLEKPEIEGHSCREVFCGLPCFSSCPLKGVWDETIKDMDVEFMDEYRQKHRVTRIAAPVYNEQGSPLGCFMVLQDHFPYSELVSRIHYEEQSLKIILDSLNMGVFTVNRNGLLTFFNQAAEKISGYNRMNLLGKEWRILFNQKLAKETGGFSRAMQEGSSVSGKSGYMIGSQGENIPVKADYIPLKNDHGRLVGGFATLQDMTLARELDKAITERYKFHDMIGKSPMMQKIFDMVKVVAATESTVLIQGDTGTGKDLLAKVIHSESDRKDRPFVKVNCAAIPDNLMESEIFGYVRGAFTGADRNKPGRFSEADTGTIFLDEIGEIPLSLQAKLLRVLEDKAFYPLGSSYLKRVDVRIITATNRRLEQLVKERAFREDLFYRLNVFRIELPPINERKADLPLLIRHILRNQAAAMKKEPVSISEEAMKQLLNYTYPGNIRELENIIEHAMIVCRDNVIMSKHLPLHVFREDETKTAACGGEKSVPSTPAAVEKHNTDKDTLLDGLGRNNWHRGRTAQDLNIDRSTLWRRMKKHNLL